MNERHSPSPFWAVCGQQLSKQCAGRVGSLVTILHSRYHSDTITPATQMLVEERVLLANKNKNQQVRVMARGWELIVRYTKAMRTRAEEEEGGSPSIHSEEGSFCQRLYRTIQHLGEALCSLPCTAHSESSPYALVLATCLCIFHQLQHPRLCHNDCGNKPAAIDVYSFTSCGSPP